MTLAAIIYLLLTIFSSYRISQSTTLSPKQKAGNIVLNCLIPILWFYLIKPIILPKTNIRLREERERLLRTNSGSRIEGYQYDD